MGTEPVGFRDPIQSVPRVHLHTRGMGWCDVTIVPNVLNPMGRVYFLMTSDLSKKERERSRALVVTSRGVRRLGEQSARMLSSLDLIAAMRLSRTVSEGFRVGKSTGDIPVQMSRRSAIHLGPPTRFLGREDGPSVSFSPG